MTRATTPQGHDTTRHSRRIDSRIRDMPTPSRDASARRFTTRRLVARRTHRDTTAPRCIDIARTTHLRNMQIVLMRELAPPRRGSSPIGAGARDGHTIQCGRARRALLWRGGETYAQIHRTHRKAQAAA